MTIEMTDEREKQLRELVEQHIKAEVEYAEADIKAKTLKKRVESLNDQVIAATRELVVAATPTPIEQLAAQKQAKAKASELPEEKVPAPSARGTRLTLARAAWDALADDARRRVKAHAKTAGAEVAESATGDIVLSVVPPTEHGAALLSLLRSLGLEVQLESVGEPAPIERRAVRLVLSGAAIEKVSADGWQRWASTLEERGVGMELLDGGGRITSPLSNTAPVTRELLALARELGLEVETTHVELAALEGPRALPAPIDPEVYARSVLYLVVAREGPTAPWVVEFEGDDKEEAIRCFNVAWKHAAKFGGEARRYQGGQLKRQYPKPAAQPAAEPAPGLRISLPDRVWAEHRDGLLDADGLALHGQWRKSSTLRMVDLEAGPVLDAVRAYAAEHHLALQTTEPF